MQSCCLIARTGNADAAPRRLMFPILLLLLVGLLTGNVSRADTVSVGFGESLPPYCLPGSESGIEVDIFREALAFKGHLLHPQFLPMKRISVEFIKGNLDGAMIDSGVDLAAAAGGHYAEPAVIYDNVFITLSEQHIKIRIPEDLRGLSVLSFPGGLERYPEWLSSVALAGNYRELNDQYLQVEALQNNRFDVVLSDKYIFAYFMERMQHAQQHPLHAIDEHHVITANALDYRAIFRSEAIARDFEAGLAHLKETGRYQEIFAAYLKPTSR